MSINKVVYSILHTVQTTAVSLLFIGYISLPSQIHATEIPNVQLSIIEFPNGPTNWVFDIVEDHFGYLWIGTIAGLFRYDGTRFLKIESNPKNPKKLSHSFIRTMLVDRNKDIWIGTFGGGLNRYNLTKASFDRILLDPTNSNEFEDFHVAHIFEDSNGDIWIGTLNEGLYLYDPDTNKLKAFRHNSKDPNTLSANSVVALNETRDGMILVGTVGGGLNYFDKVNQTFHRLMGTSNAWLQLNSSIITEIYEDTNGIVWIGTSNSGLMFLNRNTLDLNIVPSSSKVKLGLKGTFVTSIFQDEQEKLWIGTLDGGLNRLDIHSHKFQLVHLLKKQNEYLSGLWGLSFYRSRAGYYWVGSQNGIMLAKPKSIAPKQFSYKNNQQRPSISSAKIGRDSTALFGGFGGEVIHFNPKEGRFTNYRVSNEHPFKNRDDMFYSVCKDRQGHIWCGSFIGGVIRHDPKTGQSQRYSIAGRDRSNPKEQRVASLLEDQNGFIWAGTWGGIWRFDAELDRFEPISIFNGKDTNPFSEYIIEVLYECHDNTLLAGTFNSGLLEYDIKSGGFGRTIKNEKYIDYRILSLHQSKNGILWVATDRGLLKIDLKLKKVIKRYRAQDGLVDEFVKGVVEDSDGILWLDTGSHLVRFNPRTDLFSVPPDLKDIKTGPTTNCLWIADNNQVFFMSQDALISFDPYKIQQVTDPPPVVLNDIRIFDEIVPVGTMLDGRTILQSVIQETDQVTLSYKDSMVTISFAALDYRDPKSNTYAYRLKGLNNNWHYVGNQQQASYANLKPGTYVFHVKAANSQGIWNEEGQELKIVVTPPFWRTWWFNGIVLVAFLSSLWLLIKLQTFRVTQRNILLEKVVEHRTRELEKTKDDLFEKERLDILARMQRLKTNVTQVSEYERQRVGRMMHEDLSPHLIGVESMSMALVSSLKQDDPKKLDMARKIQNLVHEGIEKTRSLSKGLSPRLAIRLGLGDMLEELGNHLKNTFGTQTSLSIDEQADQLDQDTIVHAYYIIQEAVTNAIKHGKASQIDILIKTTENRVQQLRIRDNGSGLSADDSGRGMGQRIMAFRAEAIGLSLQIKEEPDGGMDVQLVRSDDSESMRE